MIPEELKKSVGVFLSAVNEHSRATHEFDLAKRRLENLQLQKQEAMAGVIQSSGVGKNVPSRAIPLKDGVVVLRHRDDTTPSIEIYDNDGDLCETIG